MRAGEVESPRLTILHTNDFHNHLSQTQAARLRMLRSGLDGSGLLLDSGDAIAAGNVTYRPGGEPILDLMSDAGYDAMTVGNREFHFTQAGFQAKIGRARFPLLCANLRARDADAKLPVVPFVMRDVAGSRVAILGLTVPMITDRMKLRVVSAYVFDDPIARATELVPGLRANCDLLVCLTHIGLARDRELALRVPGIDLIVSGHTHAHLERGERIRETLVCQAGWWGHLLGVITVERRNGRLRLEARTEPL